VDYIFVNKNIFKFLSAYTIEYV